VRLRADSFVVVMWLSRLDADLNGFRPGRTTWGVAAH
jgi:hypothetical protein